MSKLNKLKLVKGMLDLKYHLDTLYGACQKAKLLKPSLNLKILSRPLDL